MSTSVTVSLAALLALILAVSAQAHELRPAYLEIEESGAGSYSVLWKVPARGEARLALDVGLPSSCSEISPVTREVTGGADIKRWRVRCEEGLENKKVTIDGLATTYTDVIARVARADGTSQSTRLTPDAPEFVVAASPAAFGTASAYFKLGVEHIATGIDHLLFVLALMLLISNLRMLVATITSFTVAHSVTLAFAALGYSSVPQPPVEALIALSIMFVAAEVLRRQRGIVDVAGQYPWFIGFMFGLLHGFGFGGALRQIGLPQRDVPLALLTFNLGVEAGQLMFIAIVIAIGVALRTVLRPEMRLARTLAAYGIGVVSAYWFVERVTGFVA